MAEFEVIQSEVNSNIIYLKEINHVAAGPMIPLTRNDVRALIAQLSAALAKQLIG